MTRTTTPPKTTSSFSSLRTALGPGFQFSGPSGAVLDAITRKPSAPTR